MSWQRARVVASEQAHLVGRLLWVRQSPPDPCDGPGWDSFTGELARTTGLYPYFETNFREAGARSVMVRQDVIELLPEFAGTVATEDFCTVPPIQPHNRRGAASRA